MDSRAPKPARRGVVRGRTTRRLSGTPRRDARTWAMPLQYDESGFPLRPPVPTFTERVRRLIAAR